jgi:hypothetical protein
VRRTVPPSAEIQASIDRLLSKGMVDDPRRTSDLLWGRPGTPPDSVTVGVRVLGGRASGRVWVVGLSWGDDSCLVGEDDGLDTVAECELHQDPFDVRLDGPAADDEPVGYLRV